MWWLVSWAAIALVIWLVLLLFAGSVPSTVQATNRDALWLGLIALAVAAVILALAYAGVSLFQGIF